MSEFAINFLPITAPTLASLSPTNLAAYQTAFVSSIVDSANSVLLSSMGDKDTDFFAVGDAPVLEDQLLTVDPQFILNLKSRQGVTPISFADLSDRIAQLAALSTPATPTLASVSTTVPELDAVAPIIVVPTPPDADVGAAPGSAPDIAEIVLPSSPDIVLPSVPTFDELALPVAPSFDMPSFSASAPQNTIAAPTDEFSYVDPGYASALHDPLVVKLLNDLENGTYGIDSGDEAALWFRARDRAAQQSRLEIEEAARRAAATSFPMPQGAMFHAIEVAEQKAQGVLSEANREIALRRSELYVEGRKFTIQQVKEYEQVRINLYTATQERALNYSKAVVEMGVALFEARVRNFQAQLEAYKIEAQVFETRIRAELGKAELFKAQIEAEKLRADFNRAKLDLFNGQLAAINATVDLYKSRLEAANVIARIQAQRLEVYKTQISAYAERIRAKEAEYGIYNAQVRGQLANLEVYKAQIDAYNARVGGLDTQARIQLQSNEAQIQAFRAASLNYSSQLDALAKQVDARVKEVQVRGTLYSADTDAYRALIEAAAAGAKVQADLNRYNMEWNKAQLDSRVKQVEFRLKQLGMSVDLQKDINAGGIEFLRSALGGAVSGFNALAVNTTSA
jgi:hypothetical protein